MQIPTVFHKRIACFVILMGVATCTVLNAQEQDRVLAFTHVAVIDCAGAPIKPDMTILIIGDRITAVGKTGELRIPENANVVAASGKFAIPGLWDMHYHNVPVDAGLLLANGVTGRRVMQAPDDSRLLSRKKHPKETDLDYASRFDVEGLPDVPNLRRTVASPIIDGPQTVRRDTIVIADKNDVGPLVERLKSNPLIL